MSSPVQYQKWQLKNKISIDLNMTIYSSLIIDFNQAKLDLIHTYKNKLSKNYFVIIYNYITFSDKNACFFPLKT